MKKSAIALFSLAALCVAGSSFAANAVRISQVYGGGGATTGTPTYTKDYIEIFNSSGSAINISGWSISYGSATGTWGTSAGTATFTFPPGTLIQPCKYILVSAGTAGTTGGPLPVTADFDAAGINMSATNGKIGLFTAVNANVACGSEVGTIVDKIGYGSGTAICAETAAAGVLTNQEGNVRNGGGMTDTDNNSSDFTVVSGPTPRNSSSPANTACLATPTSPTTWGTMKSIYH